VEEDWSSGGEEDGRPAHSDSEGDDSDSEDIVIRDDGGELDRFLAEENGQGPSKASGERDQESDEEEGDEEQGRGGEDRFERESDSDVDPDDELPPELAKILGVGPNPAKARGGRG
jgi:hypothetical protein